MVKALFLGLIAAIAMMCGLMSAAPAPQIARQLSSQQEVSPSPSPSPSPSTSPSRSPLEEQEDEDELEGGGEEDPAARSERSTNLAHISGTARKIQMFIKNRHLQLLPDGTVNGTTDDTSAYTILQRTTVGIGQMKIQGVATCQYLCMDSCGLLYGSREFGDECVFNETIEQHHYNTYSSTKYSNERRTLYLALNRRGQPRKVQLKARQQLGRLSSYTRVLTRIVGPERADELRPVRHHAHLCSSNEPTNPMPTSTSDEPVDQPRCRKRKKRKKKKRKCLEGEYDSETCHKRQPILTNPRKTQTSIIKKCENEDSVECQRVEVTIKKKQKTKISDAIVSGGMKKKNKSKKHIKKRLRLSASTEAAVTDEMPLDEDYSVDATTTWEWVDSTVMPLIPEESENGSGNARSDD